MNTYEIDRQQLKALRNADSVCFDLLRDFRGTPVEPDKGFVSQIRANLEARHSSTGYEQTCFIPAKWRFSNYCKDGNDWYGDGMPFRCFEMVHHASHSEEWHSILRAIRPGAILTLEWMADGGESSGGYLGGARSTVPGDNGGFICVDAPLYLDRLYIRIQNPNAKSDLKFLVDYGLAPENSARMIRMSPR